MWCGIKKKSVHAVCALVVFSCFTAGWAASARAAEVDIHGYGFQGYLLSDKNQYLGAKDGTFEFTKIALLFSSKVEDRTTVWVQLFGDNNKIDLDWAFVAYRVSNDLEARAGMIKFPMGIYNEIRDNKLLQLSMLEPAMYREESDVIFESYRGVGAQYIGGPFTVDLYAGAPVIESENPNIKIVNKNLAGGRIIYQTPLEGLRLIGSYSAFRQDIIDTTGALPEFQGQNTLAVGSLDYVNYGFDIKAEYAKKKDVIFAPGGGVVHYVSYYAQAGYTFFEKLTPFVRYDYITTDEDQKTDASFYQKEKVVGVGYKFNPYFAVKAEEHWISGYALPVKNEEVAAGTGVKDWSMFVAGINFMF